MAIASRSGPLAAYTTQSGFNAISASASSVAMTPMGSPWASLPASLPTFSSEWTHTPTRSRSDRRWIVRMAMDPMPPVDQTTTRFTPDAMVPPCSLVERPRLAGPLQVAIRVVDLHGGITEFIVIRGLRDGCGTQPGERSERGENDDHQHAGCPRSLTKGGGR